MTTAPRIIVAAPMAMGRDGRMGMSLLHCPKRGDAGTGNGACTVQDTRVKAAFGAKERARRDL